ncbi:MAG: pilus assembly protein PilZ [Euryarchaeota archaeon]|nr:pilus assembly protein PilZ [Marinobacter sp.]
MRDYSEKRDFYRMQVDSPIEITTTEGETLTGPCRDLSAAGMQVYLDRAVAVGAELVTVLRSAGEPFPPLEAVCEVVRCQAEGDGYLVGLNITEVTR